MLLEFQGAMKRVKQACNIRYFDKEEPPQLKTAFPNVNINDYSNGFMVIRKCLRLIRLLLRLCLTDFFFIFNRAIGQSPLKRRLRIDYHLCNWI